LLLILSKSFVAILAFTGGFIFSFVGIAWTPADSHNVSAFNACCDNSVHEQDAEFKQTILNRELIFNSN
jgi:hypothetical protein